MKLLYLDTETTGVTPDINGVVQISGIVEINGKVEEEFDYRCRPFQGQTIDPRALSVIGKTAEEVLAYPEPKDTYGQLITVFQKYIDRYDKRDKFHLIGQNTKFDYDMMTAWFKRCGNPYLYAYIAYHLIDVICLTAMFHLAGHLMLENMKLETVAKHFNIPLDAHDAMNDIRVTREIFLKYIAAAKTIKGIK